MVVVAFKTCLHDSGKEAINMTNDSRYHNVKAMCKDLPVEHFGPDSIRDEISEAVSGLLDTDVTKILDKAAFTVSGRHTVKWYVKLHAYEVNPASWIRYEIGIHDPLFNMMVLLFPDDFDRVCLHKGLNGYWDNDVHMSEYFYLQEKAKLTDQVEPQVDHPTVFHVIFDDVSQQAWAVNRAGKDDIAEFLVAKPNAVVKVAKDPESNVVERDGCIIRWHSTFNGSEVYVKSITGMPPAGIKVGYIGTEYFTKVCLDPTKKLELPVSKLQMIHQALIKSGDGSLAALIEPIL
jgi:hypothetical protein